MLTKKQIESLPKGFHSNIELMKKFPESKHFLKGYRRLMSKIFQNQ